MADREPLAISFTDAGPFYPLDGALAAILTLRFRGEAKPFRRMLITRDDLHAALKAAGNETRSPELKTFLDYVRSEDESQMVLLTWGDFPQAR